MITDRVWATERTAMAAWATHLGSGNAPTRVRSGVRVGIDGYPVPRLRGRLHQGAVIPTAFWALIEPEAAINCDPNGTRA